MVVFTLAVVLCMSAAGPPSPADPAADVAKLTARQASIFAGVELVRRSTPTDPALVAELVRVVQNDRDFEPGTEARERAVLALANTTNAAGFYSFEHEGQAEILAESITDLHGPAQREVIQHAHLLPASAKPQAIRNLHHVLTERHDPILIMDTVSALGLMGPAAGGSAGPIRLLLEDPARSRPQLWKRVLRTEAEWDDPTISSELRSRAALARIQLGKLREDMADLYPKLDPEGRVAAARAILARLLETRGRLDGDDTLAVDALRFLRNALVDRAFDDGLQTGGVSALGMVIENPGVAHAVKQQAVDTFLALCPPESPDGHWLRERIRGLGLLPTGG